MTLSEPDILRFFDRQLQNWPEVQQRFDDLSHNVQTRDLQTGQLKLRIQFNPSRIRSTQARIDRHSLELRPCFLCEKNRPPQQFSYPVGNKYLILVNPYPILPLHLTIPTQSHEPQKLSTLLDFIKLALSELPDFLFFYNGARCGASAPDHAHLQAVLKGEVPIERDWKYYENKLEPLFHNAPSRQQNTLSDGIFSIRDYACPALAALGDNRSLEPYLMRILSALPVHAENTEPEFNLLAWNASSPNASRMIAIVFPRQKHRPGCYFADGDAQRMISPGALDMGGLLITPRQEDFLRTTAENAKEIIKEVGVSTETFRQIITKIRQGKS